MATNRRGFPTQADAVTPPTPAPDSSYTPGNSDDWQTLAPPTDVQEALDQLAARGQRVVLGALAVGGSWNPSEYIGPSYGTASSANVSTFSGSGYYRASQALRLSNFVFQLSSPIAYESDLHIYVGTNPTAMAFAGVLITTEIGAYVMTNDLDTLDLDEGDCVAILNTDPVNTLGVGACAFTALAIPL